MSAAPTAPVVAVIGGGPAGLMAAETLAGAGVQPALFDSMPSVGRKFLLAGKGGMNLTHSEEAAPFLARYGEREAWLAPMIEGFGPQHLRAWAQGLGVETFVGSSGRVFPRDMKAAPLLRAWLQRLRASGVTFHMRHRWLGWDENQNNQSGALRFATPDGEKTIAVDAVVLALGGASWPQLGSDAAWLPLLEQRGVEVAALAPANCGFETGWSEHFAGRYAGHPVKSVTASFTDASGQHHCRPGEFMVSQHGVEGSLIYALSAPLRDTIAACGRVDLQLDLAPGKSLQRVIDEVTHARGARSMASHLQSRAGITGVKAGLLRELSSKEQYVDPLALAGAIKSLPLRLHATRPIAEAISSAGGVKREELNRHLMLTKLPGVFCAGEMLDWEAPTGGYLLSACFASGHSAGLGALDWLSKTVRTN